MILGGGCGRRRICSMKKDAQKPVDTPLRERLLASRQANYENLDKAILSLSSGALVLSMAFFKDVVPIELAIRMNFLFGSWILLGLTIGVNLISFWVSQKAHDLRLDEIDGPKRENAYSVWTERLNRVGIIFFLVAMTSSIFFVIANVSEAQRKRLVDIPGRGLTLPSSDTTKPVDPTPDRARPVH